MTGSTTKGGPARPVRRAVVGAVLVLLVAGALTVAVNLAAGTWQVTPVLSGSMRPGLPVGGVVVSQRIPASQLAARDVILFQNPDKRSEQMVHRIVKLTHGPAGTVVIRTQGDANRKPDPWTLTVRSKDVYVVRWSLPLLGYVAVAFQDNRAQLLVIAGLLLVAVGEATIVADLRRSLRDAERPTHRADVPGRPGLHEAGR